jgi:hypothetical protein
LDIKGLVIDYVGFEAIVSSVTLAGLLEVFVIPSPFSIKAGSYWLQFYFHFIPLTQIGSNSHLLSLATYSFNYMSHRDLESQANS